MAFLCLFEIANFIVLYLGTMVLSDRFAEELRSLETEIVPGERA